MPIELDCENCHKRLKVPDSAAGKKGRCNDCGHLNPIPVVASAQATPHPQTVIDDQVSVVQPLESANPNATYNVKSAVNGAVFGPADSATLQQWLDEGRITADCQLQEAGSDAWTPASQMFPALGAVAAGTVASGPLAQSGLSSATPTNADALNPYATTSNRLTPAGPDVLRDIVPTTGDIGFCISHGWKVWTENFGLLLAVSVTVMAVGWAFSFIQGLLQGSLLAAGGVRTMILGIGLFTIVSVVVQNWLGLGLAKLLCQLCRGERAGYSTLFVNGARLPLFLLVLFLFYLPFVLFFGAFYLVVGPEAFSFNNEPLPEFLAVILGSSVVAVLMGLILWPVYYLLADTKMGVGQMLRTGSAIGLKNCLAIIPLIVIAGLVSFMGIFLCVVGLVATMSAGQTMIATAYLNMSGQLRPR